MELTNLRGYEILLASKSPRRHELLRMLDLDFRQAPAIEVEEVYPSELEAELVPEYLSQLKAEAYREVMTERQLIITADTIVIVGGTILGKPRDNADAARMLRMLSGRTHQVVTGLTIMTREKRVTFRSLTDVEFASIPEGEIDEYVRRYSPLDKAGAYGIQEWIGAVGIRSITGSFYNVMGLPVHLLWQYLKEF